MFARTHTFFYNIEGASMYYQDKMFGKYARPHWGYRIIELTTLSLIVFLTYLAQFLVDLHPLYIFYGLSALGLICVFFYYRNSKYDILDEYKKLSDFNRLSTPTKLFYLVFLFIFVFSVPLTLVLLLIYDSVL